MIWALYFFKTYFLYKNTVSYLRSLLQEMIPTSFKTSLQNNGVLKALVLKKNIQIEEEKLVIQIEEVVNGNGKRLMEDKMNFSSILTIW